MDLVRAINIEMILYKMLCKRIVDKYKDNILNYVVASSGGGKVSWASHTWAELAGNHD